jgi:hypothetical protein
MATRVRERATGKRCKRGAPIIERVEDYYVENQSEPFETTTELRCCRQCDDEQD